MPYFTAVRCENQLDSDGYLVGNDNYSESYFGLFDSFEAAASKAKELATEYNEWVAEDNAAPENERDEWYAGGYTAVYSLYEDGQWKLVGNSIANLDLSVRFTGEYDD